jgi:hypothetical protein
MAEEVWEVEVWKEELQGQPDSTLPSVRAQAWERVEH